MMRAGCLAICAALLVGSVFGIVRGIPLYAPAVIFCLFLFGLLFER